MSKTYGYIRVSTIDQNTARQETALQDSNYTCTQTFIDKASGKDINRPQFQKLLSTVTIGDTIIVHSLDRLGRSVSDMCQIVSNLKEQGITLISIKDNLVFDGQVNPMRDLQMHMLTAFAEFERSLIRERQAEGIAAKKARGERTGRPPADKAKVAEVNALVAKGIKLKLACQNIGIGVSTYYKLKAA